MAYNSDDNFRVYNQEGALQYQFSREEFMDNISELRTDWTLAKFPYLTRLGFPSGIMLVGPLSRSFQEDSPLNDPDLADLDLTGYIGEPFITYAGKLRRLSSAGDIRGSQKDTPPP